MIYKEFEENTIGEDYVVGDIHGHFSDLESELDLIGFDRKKDRLFCVGDLIDRGPESYMALDFLKNEWFITIRGNHEQMLIDTHKEQFPSGPYPSSQMGSKGLWLSNGGDWALGDILLDTSGRELEKWAKSFDSLPYTISVKNEGRTIALVHAEVPGNSYYAFRNGLVEQIEGIKTNQPFSEWALWSRHYIKKAEVNLTYLANPDIANEQLGDKERIDDIDFVISGHTPLIAVAGLKKTDEPFFIGNRVYIDSGKVFRGRTGKFIIKKISEIR